MSTVTTEDLRLALVDALSPALSPAQNVVDLTDVARAASALTPEECKAMLIKAAQQRRYVVRMAS